MAGVLRPSTTELRSADYFARQNLLNAIKNHESRKTGVNILHSLHGLSDHLPSRAASEIVKVSNFLEATSTEGHRWLADAIEKAKQARLALRHQVCHNVNPKPLVYGLSSSPIFTNDLFHKDAIKEAIRLSEPLLGSEILGHKTPVTHKVRVTPYSRPYKNSHNTQRGNFRNSSDTKRGSFAPPQFNQSANYYRNSPSTSSSRGGYNNQRTPQYTASTPTNQFLRTKTRSYPTAPRAGNAFSNYSRDDQNTTNRRGQSFRGQPSRGQYSRGKSNTTR